MLNFVSGECASLNRQVNEEGNQRSILIVDDEPAVLHTTALILRHAGYSTATAAKAEDAVQLLNSQAFRLLLLDGIPKRQLVIQEARRVHPGVRVALNVGNPDLGDLSQLEVDAVIQKPIVPSMFLAKIHELLNS